MKKMLILALLCCWGLFGEESHRDPYMGMVLTTEQHSYELQNCVGGGASGTIYKAISEEGQTVAIKIFIRNLMSDVFTKSWPLPIDLGPVLSLSNEKEWEVGTQFNHPNIIKAYDRGVIRDVKGVNHPKPFIVIEFVSGMTFLQVCEKKLCQETAILLLVQLLDALKYGFIKEMYYHDLHLANFMITEDNCLKIVDLGSFIPLASVTTEEGCSWGFMNIYSLVKQILKKSGCEKKQIKTIGKQMKEALKTAHENGLTEIELYTRVLERWSFILQQINPPLSTSRL
ncbi:MAG: protein kinase [Chlamydiales bacterium]